MVEPATATMDRDGGEALSTLRALFDAHAGYVWSTLRRLGVPSADLEDLTHDVFLQVYRRLDVYDPLRPVRPWLFGFAYRIASQHRRRAHRRHETPGAPEAAPAPGLLPSEAPALREPLPLLLAPLP